MITIQRLRPAVVHRWVARHNIIILRISMGAVIFGFGILKYFPGVSPAENLVLETTTLLTFGLIPGKVAMVLLATAECAIGLSLMIGRGLRVIRYLLVLWALGILSPAVLMTGELFMGPYHAPTLEGQYVLKDVVLLTASLVIATTLSHAERRTSTRPAGHELDPARAERSPQPKPTTVRDSFQPGGVGALEAVKPTSEGVA